ncbi:MAG: HAD family hydrolase [Planctomycetota bacterium]|nr:MAG: HAD family hydrolase [Planctomycetota bacterium]
MTGEEKPVLKKKGQKVWAGGVLLGKKASLEVLKPLHESFFANLWKKSQKGSEKSFSSFLNQISPYFTVIVLLLSLGSLFYWGIQQNWSLGFYTFSSVLIVACPCGIALSGPFTHGFLLRLLSKEGIYLPSGRALDELARIRHLVFDKTGTLTVRRIQLLPILEKLTEEQKQAFLALASQSFHPVSQGLIERLRERENSLIHDSFLQEVKEIGGKGIQGLWKGKHLAIGKLSWLKGEEGEDSRVGLKWEKEILGIYEIQTCFRKGLEKIIPFLSHQFTLHVLTGDGEGDKEKLIRLFPPKTPIFFHCTPEEKRRYILHLMKKGPTAMIGDGINDSAALSASNAAIVIMEENAHFMPDADCAIESSQIFLLPKLFKVAQKAKKIIIASLCLSLIYNGIGLYYAFHGWLSPLFLGILMPLSSLSIMIFTCFMSYITYLTIFRRNDYGSALSPDSSQSFSCSLVSGNFYSSGSERPV